MGVVYKLDPAGNQTVLYNFTGGADGGGPFAGLTRDAAGNLYGTTMWGGIGGGVGTGVLFKLDIAGNFTVLHRFDSGTYMGLYAGVTIDQAGNLYGDTFDGGVANCSGLYGDCGVVYKLDAAGTYSVLHAFKGGADGGGPAGNLSLGPGGHLWGTGSFDGKYGGGVIFVIQGATAGQ